MAQEMDVDLSANMENTDAMMSPPAVFGQKRPLQRSAEPPFSHAPLKRTGFGTSPLTPVHKRLAMDNLVAEPNEPFAISAVGNFSLGPLAASAPFAIPAPARQTLRVAMPETVGFARSIFQAPANLSPDFAHDIRQESARDVHGRPVSHFRVGSAGSNGSHNSSNGLTSPTTPITPTGASEPRFMRGASPRTKEAMKPDFRAFEQTLVPLDTARPNKTAPPAPQHNRMYGTLMRKNSLYDTKTLFEFTHDSNHTTTKSLQVLGVVGEGSFFVVEKVRHLNDGHVYAHKKAKLEFKGKSDRSNYLNEIKTVAQNQPHDHIVTYHYAWQEDCRFHMILEYLPCNLTDYALHVFPQYIPEDVLLDWTVQLCKGLDHVHHHRIVHLDIKPANILVATDCTLKIGDFGQAVLNGTREAEGDSRYLAPELLDDANPEGAAPSADMFSLGMLLLELSTRLLLPTEGNLWRDLRQGNLQTFLEKVPFDKIRQLIQALLNPNPRLRPSAAQIVAAYGSFYKVPSSKLPFPAALAQQVAPLPPPHVRRGSFTQCVAEPPWPSRRSSASLETLDELAASDDA